MYSRIFQKHTIEQFNKGVSKMKVLVTKVINGIRLTDGEFFESETAGLLSFGKRYNLVGLRWSVVVDEPTKISVETVVNADNFVIMTCEGSERVINELRAITGKKELLMFPT